MPSFAPVRPVAVKAESVHTFTLEGVAAAYGGADVENEYFDRATNFGLAWGRVRPLMYDHGMHSKLGAAVLGLAELDQTDEAVFFEAELEKSKTYHRQILALAKAGLLGASIGAIAHLVQRRQAGSRRYLAAFPVGELSLTVTPAEPRLVGAVRAKAARIAPALVPADAADAELRALHAEFMAGEARRKGRADREAARVFSDYLRLDAALTARLGPVAAGVRR